MKRFAKFFALTFLPLALLTACSSSPDTTTSNENKAGPSANVIYNGAEFSVSVPKDWEVLEKDQLGSSYTKGLLVAFRNNIKSSTFTSNINILESDVPDNMSLKDFVDANKAGLKQALIQYVETSTKNVDLKGGQKAMLIEFQGKKDATSSLTNFKQLYTIKGKKAFLLTASYLATEDAKVVKSLDDTISSFMLK
ncbi:hypothetical protein HZC20_02205 [Candidatus Peregrinibacteria bacterium]|nr:hypothetical protein [Candidatus Peregrinibacteria bacterium]